MRKTEQTAEDVQPVVATDASGLCPYVGLFDDPDTRAMYARVDHRCHLPGTTQTAPDPAWQERYCLSGRHDQCPIYRAIALTDDRRAVTSATRRWVWATMAAVALFLIVAGGIVAMQLGNGDTGANGLTSSTPTPISALTTHSTTTPTVMSATPTPIVILAASPTAADVASTSYVLTVTPEPTTTAPAATPTPEPAPTENTNTNTNSDACDADAGPANPNAGRHYLRGSEWRHAAGHRQQIRGERAIPDRPQPDSGSQPHPHRTGTPDPRAVAFCQRGGALTSRGGQSRRRHVQRVLDLTALGGKVRGVGDVRRHTAQTMFSPARTCVGFRVKSRWLSSSRTLMMTCSDREVSPSSSLSKQSANAQAPLETCQILAYAGRWPSSSCIASSVADSGGNCGQLTRVHPISAAVSRITRDRAR